MNSSLGSHAVQAVLGQISHLDAMADEPGKARVRAAEARRGARIYGAERAQLYGEAPLSVAPEVGALLYALTMARRPELVVEFGASVGFSTIHLGCALRDLARGRIVSTELSAVKARLAEANLCRAGLNDLVELRVGDAMDTLADDPANIDLLFLDGFNDLYLPLLELLRPRLAPYALVVADLSAGDPHHDRFRSYVCDPAEDFATVELPLDEGVLVSVYSSRSTFCSSPSSSRSAF